MKYLLIRDIDGDFITVTDLDAAIMECELCKDSPLKLESGHTVGQNYSFMLGQLKQLKQSQKQQVK